MEDSFISYVLQIFYAIIFVLAVSALVMVFGFTPSILSGGRKALDEKLSITERNVESNHAPAYDSYPKITVSDVYYDILNSDATIPILIYRGHLAYNDNGDVISNVSANISVNDIKAFQEGNASIVKNKLYGTNENTLFEKRYKKNSDGTIKCIVYIQV